MKTRDQLGLTLIELVVSAAILAILAAAAMPLFEVSVRRGREIELRRGLRILRRAIDEFHLSYVASGGKTSQGPVVLPGRPAGLPGQPSQGGNRPGQPFPNQAGQAGQNPPGFQNQNRPGMAGMQAQKQRQQQIELIDVSQFDPIDSKGYPPDLKTLVDGVQTFGGTSEELVRFLRRVPRDPMVPAESIDPNDENFGWGVCSYQDNDCPEDSTVWGRQNVYDVFTKSRGTALDGSKYRDW